MTKKAVCNFHELAALAHLGERQTEDSLVIWRYCVRATEAAFLFFTSQFEVNCIRLFFGSVGECLKQECVMRFPLPLEIIVTSKRFGGIILKSTTDIKAYTSNNQNIKI